MTFSPSDYIAACVARTAPQKIATLLSTRATTGAEKLAMGELLPTVKECMPKGQEAHFNQPGLRAILATASYRIVQAGKAVDRSQ